MRQPDPEDNHTTFFHVFFAINILKKACMNGKWMFFQLPIFYPLANNNYTLTRNSPQ